MNEKKRFYLGVLSNHKVWLYDKLLYEHHITSTCTMECELLDEYGEPFIHKGYFALKNRTKYFIDLKTYNKLPIKIGKNNEELKYKEFIVKHPLDPIPFKIMPESKFDSFKQLVDEFCDFNHSNMTQWILYKIIVLMGDISRIYVCIASNSEFGKSAGYKVLNTINDRTPVFKPRSVPGVLNKITGIGNMVFDDCLEAEKKVRNIMEEFSLKMGDNSREYINGALKSNQTKEKYNTQNQSITYLYNNIDSYKDEDNYFENFFENNKAIDTRFLKLKFNGRLLESFNEDFDLKKVAEENRMYYINFAKHLLWMQEVKSSCKYKLRYDKPNVDLKGRKKAIWDNIVWGIDLYSDDQSIYNELISALNEGIEDYHKMITKNEWYMGENKRMLS